MRPHARLYAAAIFLSSSLLFLVEPMAGKRLLPLLGGSAAVWITCLVFFQTVLLLGYLCAHAIATRLPHRVQIFVYAFLLAVSLAQVAMNLNPHPHASTLRPVWSVLLVLTSLIGLPFLVLSATNPLLQAWYARGVAGGDGAAGALVPAPPYRLFALSNFGSLLALLAYPVLVEPYFSLRAQTLAWAAAFVVYVIVCGAVSFSGNPSVHGAPAVPRPAPLEPQPVSPPSRGEQVLWLMTAACGALLLSAVTSHLSQNIAAIPLLWILPLTIYLLTFVIAFNGGSWYPRRVVVGVLPVALAAIGYVIASVDRETPIRYSVPIFCSSLFIGCLFCHGELYRRRPSPRFITRYYLFIAAGGALGSMFVGVWAPFVFRGSYEMAWSLVYTAALALVVLWNEHWAGRLFWTVATAGMLVVVVLHVRSYGENTTVQVRSFYGVLRVLQDSTPEAGMYRTLVHGTIQHGTQYFGSDDDRTSPTTYYVHASGIGLALDHCCQGKPRRVALVGLGAGTLAAYGEPGDVFRFYEINSQVEMIARNVFTYLKESKAKIEIVEGDARLSMEAEPPQGYDVIAVDAFSGDAVPVHLLTAEALQLYRRHMRPGGILAFHISNTYLNLAPVVEAEAGHVGLPAVLIASPDDEYTGGYAADWVLVTDNQEFLNLPPVAGVADKIEPKPGFRLWTDDYSSLLPLIKWQSKAKKD